MKEMSANIRCIKSSFYVLMSVFTLYPLDAEEQVSETIRLILYILCFISSYKFVENKEIVDNLFSNFWKKVILLVLEFYTVLAVDGMYILDANVEYIYSIPKIIYIFLSYIWIRPIVYQIIVFLLEPINIGNKQERKSSIKNRIILFFLILLPNVIFLIAFNPAITSSDSEDCFNKAYLLWNNGFSLPDWHPPFYIFVLNCITRVVNSISAVIIAQQVYFSFVFESVLNYLYQKGINRKYLVILYFASVLSISNLIQLTTLWKDVPYTISMIWLTYLCIYYAENSLVKNSWYIKLVVSIIFIVSFRQNGILSAFAVVVLLTIYSKFSKKILCSCICIGLLVGLIKGPLYSSMGVYKVPQLKFFSLANDMMNGYYRGNRVSEDVMEIINKITENNPDDFNYNPYYVHYNNDEPKDYGIIEFLSIYIDNFFDNPRDTLMAILERNTHLWSIAKPRHEQQVRICYTGEMHELDIERYEYRKNNVLTGILDKINIAMADNSVTYIVFWRAGLYNLLIIFLFGIYLVKEKRWYSKKILPFIPILFNLIALAVGSGWGGNFRYFWPSVTISLFLLYYVKMMHFEEKDRND